MTGQLYDGELLATLVGQTITAIEGLAPGSEEIHLTLADGRRFWFWHEQNCCETVSVNEVIGDVAWLVGSPLTIARQDSSTDAPAPAMYNPDEGTYTWTFYTLATVRGTVVVRWLGASNGCYGEAVSFWKVP